MTLPGVFVYDASGNIMRDAAGNAIRVQSSQSTPPQVVAGPGQILMTIGNVQKAVPEWVQAAYGDPVSDRYQEAVALLRGIQAGMGIAVRSSSSAGNALSDQAALSAAYSAGSQVGQQAADVARQQALSSGSMSALTGYSANYERNRSSSSGAVADIALGTPQALTSYNPISEGEQVVKNLYVPEGSYMQQQLENVKLGGSQSGELAWYEKLGLNEAGQQRMTVNPETGKLEPYILIGGGGRGAAQSGMISFIAATPAVFGRGEVQKGEAGLISPNVMATGVAESGLTGIEVFNIVKSGNAGGYDISDYLSKLGAEAYGGMVGFVDKRTLGTITYEDVSNRADWNVARYFDPMAVNRGKAELPGANIPWSVGESTPAFFFMDKNTVSGEDVFGFQGVPKNIAAYVPEYGLLYPGGDVTGLGKRISEPRTVLTGALISYGDIKAVPEAMGLTGRLVGSKTVAGVATVSEVANMDLPMPFRSTSKAAVVFTGEISKVSGAPASIAQTYQPSDMYIGMKGITSGLPDIVKTPILGATEFFFPGADVTTYLGKPEVIKTGLKKEELPKQGGADYSNVFISSETGKKTVDQSAIYTLTEAPMITQTYTERESADTKISKTLGLYGLGEAITPQFVKENALVIGSAAPPVGISLMIPGVKEYSSELVSAGIKTPIQKPLTVATVVAATYVTGGIFGALDVGAGAAEASLLARGATATGVRGTALTGAGIGVSTIRTAAPIALATGYSIDVFGRTTNWGSDFSPKSAGRFGEIFTAEALPGLFGFTRGARFTTGLSESYKNPLTIKEQYGRFGSSKQPSKTPAKSESFLNIKEPVLQVVPTGKATTIPVPKIEPIPAKSFEKHIIPFQEPQQRGYPQIQNSKGVDASAAFNERVARYSKTSATVDIEANWAARTKRYGGVSKDLPYATGKPREIRSKPGGLTTEEINANWNARSVTPSLKPVKTNEDPLKTISGAFENAVKINTMSPMTRSGEIEITKELQIGGIEKTKQLSEFEIRAKEREAARLDYERQRAAFEKYDLEKASKQKVIIQPEKERLAQISRERYGLVKVGQGMEIEFNKQFELGGTKLKGTQKIMEGERPKETVKQREVLKNPFEIQKSKENVILKQIVGERQNVRQKETVRQREILKNPFEIQRTRETERERMKEIERQFVKEFPKEQITTGKFPTFPSFGGSGGGGGGLKRRGAFLELFNVGLDLTVGRPRRAPAAKRFTKKAPKQTKTKTRRPRK